MGVEIRSQRARKVAGMFGVKELQIENCQLPIANFKLRPGTMTLVTGASGGGKSTLLRQLRDKHRERDWVDVGEIELPDVTVVDCFESDDLVDVLMLLGRGGLGDQKSINHATRACSGSK